MTEKKKYIKITNDKPKKTYPKTEKLSEDNYVRPKETVSELLSADEIKLRLVNYEKVESDNIKKLTPTARIQYFEVIKDDDQVKFKYKPGGIIISNGYPKYLALSNGKKSWSVQLENHIIFKEKDYDQLKKEYDKKLHEKDKQIEHLTYLVSKYKKELQDINKKN